MRLSQALVIAAATLLLASDTVAVATSNQAKISKMVQSTPSQRLLRGNKYPIYEEEDDSEDSVDLEERGFATPDEEELEERSPLSSSQVKKLEGYAQRWKTTWEKVAMGTSHISAKKAEALLALRDAYISGVKSEKDVAKMLILMANKS